MNIEEIVAEAEQLAVSGQNGRAADLYESILSEGREWTGDLLYNIAATNAKARNFAHALQAAEACCFFSPEKARNWLALNHIQAKLGDRSAALRSLYRALELEPHNTSIHDTRLFHLATTIDPEAYRREAELVNLPGASPLCPRPSSPERRITVGYVSGDFRTHVMDRFILALLRNHDVERFRVICFDNSPLRDKKSEEMRALPGIEWSDIDGLSDEQASVQIQAAHVDVLFDLSGLSAHHRLGVFKKRPAPLQITGIGHLPTTGAACFDWRIADYEVQSQYTESLWRLPRAAVPEPLHPEIPVIPGYREADGIVFGYVNGLHKLNDASVAKFVEVLLRILGSRLLIMAPGASDPATVKMILRRFDPVQEKIFFTESNGGAAFCKIFESIDIALDPAPYGGCTTTLDTLFHGVPIVTSRPDRRTAADAWYLQRELGLRHLCDDFVSQACFLAADRDQLAITRRTLRAAYLAHPVGNPRAWVRSLEEAYVKMIEMKQLRAAA